MLSLATDGLPVLKIQKIIRALTEQNVWNILDSEGEQYCSKSNPAHHQSFASLSFPQHIL